MSEIATPPAAVSNPAPAAAPAPAIKDITASDLINMTEGLDLSKFDEMLAIPASKPKEAFSGTVPDVNLKPAVDPLAPLVPPVAPAAPAAATPPAPVVPAPEGEEPSPEKLGKFRVQAKDFKEAELLRHMKTMPASEAYAKVYGAPAPVAPAAEAPAATPASPATPAAPVANPAIDTLKAEIAKLEADADKAAEDMDPKTANQLNRQAIAKANQLRDLERDSAATARAADEAKHQQAESNFQQRVTESAKDVYAARPSLADKASPDRVEFDAFVNLKFGDPDYQGIFDSAKWPQVIYREFAEAKGWGKAVAPAAAPALPAATPSASAAPRVTSAEVLQPGNTPGGSPVNAAQLMTDLKTLSVAQLDAILGKV